MSAILTHGTCQLKPEEFFLTLTSATQFPSGTKKPGTDFITFLIREKVNKDYESDVEQSLKKIRKHYSTGCLLAQYLMTAMENGEVVDYLKAYLEVKSLQI